jgi:hypothetical protein
MMEQRSKRGEPADVSHVDYLLGALSRLSQHDPSPALRERLELLAAQRLRDTAGSGKRIGTAPLGFLSLLRPAFVAVLIIAIGIVLALVAHIRQPEHLQARIQSQIAPPKTPFSSGIHTQPEIPAAKPKTRHSLSTSVENFTPRRMVVRLPYSNSAIDTGTDTTIRVSMSQTELVSLGFPMNATLPDRRVVAELTLGDDGLPRAISVPLPFEVIREKK